MIAWTTPAPRSDIRRSRWAFAVLAAAVWLRGVDVDACTGPFCSDLFTPSVAPSNLPALAWRPNQSVARAFTAADIVTVRRVSDASLVPVRVVPHVDRNHHHWVVFDRPLEPDTEYLLQAPRLCPLAAGSVEHRFRTRAAHPLPTVPGRLVVSQQARREISVYYGGFSSSCMVFAGVRMRTVTVVHDAVSAPWAEAFVYDTRVDGNPWAWIGSPSESNLASTGIPARVYLVCERPDGRGGSFGGVYLAPGLHRVEVDVRLPGTDLRWTLNTEVELSCGPVESPDAGVGADVIASGDLGALDGTVATDGGVLADAPRETDSGRGSDGLDARVARPDSGASEGVTDRGADAISTDVSVRDRDGGCSARPRSRPPLGATIAPFLLLVFAARLRRSPPLVRQLSARSA